MGDMLSITTLANGPVAQPGVSIVQMLIASAVTLPDIDAISGQLARADLTVGDSIITTGGNVVVTFTSLAYSHVYHVPVTTADTTASLVAGHLRMALSADTALMALYSLSGTNPEIILTAIAAGLDSTMSCHYAGDGTVVGLGMEIDSTHCSAGADPLIVAVGGQTATINDVSTDDLGTTITFTAPSGGSYGVADVTLTYGATHLTTPNGLMLINPADTRSGSAVPFYMVDEVFIDGVCAGFAGEGAKITPTFAMKSYIGPNSFMAGNKYAYLTDLKAEITFDQVNGALLATLLGGTYNLGMLGVPGNQEVGSHAIAVKDTNGMVVLLPYVKPSGTVTWEIGKKDFAGIPTTWEAYRPTGDNALIVTGI